MQRRSAALRIAKWVARMQQEAVCPVMQRRLEHATDKMASYVSSAVGVESQIRQVLEGKATGGTVIPVISIPYYLGFGRECYRIQRGEFAGPSGNMAAQCLKTLWTARGLDSLTLIQIALIFGYVVA
jgi:hypothetical protein